MMPEVHMAISRELFHEMIAYQIALLTEQQDTPEPTTLDNPPTK